MRAASRARLPLRRRRCSSPRRSLVAEHDEERRVQVKRRVLQRAHDLGRDDVARDAHDEQLAETCVEEQLGGTRESLQPRIVAYGRCPFARSASTSFCTVGKRASPRTKRSLPALRRASAWSAV